MIGSPVTAVGCTVENSAIAIQPAAVCSSVRTVELASPEIAGTTFAAVSMEAAVSDVIHIAVVVVMTMVPTATIESVSPIAAAIVNAAVEADIQTPITGIPSVISAVPAPISWSP